MIKFLIKFFLISLMVEQDTSNISVWVQILDKNIKQLRSFLDTKKHLPLNLREILVILEKKYKSKWYKLQEL